MTDRTMERTSRRGLLATALGGLAAAAAATLSGPATVRAAGQGQALVLGEPNTATGITAVEVQNVGKTVNTSTGLSARSPGGDGLAGRSGGNAKSGVFGRSDHASGFALYGYNSARSTRGSLGGSAAVEGHAEVTGGYGASVAARFEADGPPGIAIVAHGKVLLPRIAGVAIIPAGATSVTVTPGIDIISEPAILLTPRTQIGNPLWATSNATNNTITIRTSLPVTKKTKISYLIIG